MKKTLLTLMVTSVLALPIAFADGQSHGSGNMMGMMNMDRMQMHTKNMDKIMKQAHNTKDMNKQQELMTNHMKEMRDMMAMMQDTMGNYPRGHDMGDGKMMKNSKNIDMMKRQQHMELQMNMMQKMMDHMMDQQELLMDQHAMMK